MTRKEEVAWAAGFYEGEGHIILHRQKNGYANWRIAVTNTDMQLLEKFQRIMACGRIYQTHKANKKRKDCFVLSIARADDIWRVVAEMWPHLGDRRQDQILDSIIAREAYYEEVKARARAAESNAEKPQRAFKVARSRR